MASTTLPDGSSVESFFNIVETGTLALFERLSFENMSNADDTNIDGSDETRVI